MAYDILSREELISALENLTGVDQFAAAAATDPLANVGGASVVPPPDYAGGQFGGLGAADRVGGAETPFYDQQFPYFGFDQTKQGVGADFTTDPNFARAMRESRSPTGFDYSSMPAGEEVIDMATGLRPVDDASVVLPIGETIDRVMRQPEQGRAPIADPADVELQPASEQDLMFHRIQKEIRRGEEPEAPQWMIDMVRAVPEEDWASAFAGDDEELRAFHQKHGFPPAVGG